MCELILGKLRFVSVREIKERESVSKFGCGKNMKFSGRENETKEREFGRGNGEVKIR